MSISEELKIILDNKEKVDEIREVLEFMEKMASSGFLIKHEYNLPPVDTIGRRAFELVHSNINTISKNIL